MKTHVYSLYCEGFAPNAHLPLSYSVFRPIWLRILADPPLIRSYGYASAGDQPTCFASLTGNSKSR